MSPSPPVPVAIPWHRRLEARVIVGVTIVAGLCLAAVLFVTSRMVSDYSFDRSRADLVAAREAFRRLVDTRSNFASSEVRLITELPIFREFMTRLQSHTPSMDGMAEDYCGKIGADFCVVTNADGRWIGRSGAPAARDSDTLVAVIETARQGQARREILDAKATRLPGGRRAGAVRVRNGRHIHRGLRAERRGRPRAVADGALRRDLSLRQGRCVRQLAPRRGTRGGGGDARHRVTRRRVRHAGAAPSRPRRLCRRDLLARRR